MHTFLKWRGYLPLHNLQPGGPFFF